MSHTNRTVRLKLPMNLFRRGKRSRGHVASGPEVETTVGAGSQVGVRPFVGRSDIYRVPDSIPRGQIKPGSRWLKESVYENGDVGPAERVTVLEFQDDGFILYKRDGGPANEVPGKTPTDPGTWHVFRPADAYVVEAAGHLVVLTPVR